jgi:hypothetical protein
VVPTISLSSISPAQGSPSRTPTLFGIASKVSTVRLYYDGSCSQLSSDGVSNTAFPSPGITVSTPVAANAVTVIYGQAVDPAGNASECKQLVSYTHDDIFPTVASVTSTLASGGYKAGDVIPISVTFSETVVVSGVPQLKLATGAGEAILDYISGSNTNSLQFSYTVAAGQQANPLDYAGTGALVTNGGSVRDLVGNAAVLTLPNVGSSGSLSGSKSFVIDTLAPTFSYTSITPGVAGSNRAPTIEMSLSEPTTVTVYSNDSCSSVVSAATSLNAGSGQRITTNPLAANATTVLYARAVDAVGNMSVCGNLVVYTHDDINPTVVSFDRDPAQDDSTNSLPVNFKIKFSEQIYFIKG